MKIQQLQSKNFKNAMDVCGNFEIEELLCLNKKIRTGKLDDLKNYYDWLTAISIHVIKKDKVYSSICYN